MMQSSRARRAAQLAFLLAVPGLVQAYARAAAAEELTAQQIVDKALGNNSFGFDNAVARVVLTLNSKRGAERVRDVEIRSQKKDDRTKSLVRFHSPADVAGTGFLVLENKDRDDDQYLYLPAIGKVKRITGSQKNQRFMGTDLTYADMESRNLRKGKSTKLADANVGGNDCYVLESVPADPEDSQYGKTISYIHKVSFVALKVEFFDKTLQPLKKLTVKRLEKRGTQWVVMESTIENSQEETKTDFSIKQLDLDPKLGDEEFTEKALQGG